MENGKKPRMAGQPSANRKVSSVTLFRDVMYMRRSAAFCFLKYVVTLALVCLQGEQDVPMQSG
jgi:hypothetical protein